MTAAVEALRKARATRNCDGQTLDTCEFVQHPDVEFDWLDVLTPTEPSHELYASALLDGFSCAEVTRAERELEQLAAERPQDVTQRTLAALTGPIPAAETAPTERTEP